MELRSRTVSGLRAIPRPKRARRHEQHVDSLLASSIFPLQEPHREPAAVSIRQVLNEVPLLEAATDHQPSAPSVSSCPVESPSAIQGSVVASAAMNQNDQYRTTSVTDEERDKSPSPEPFEIGILRNNLAYEFTSNVCESKRLS